MIGADVLDRRGSFSTGEVAGARNCRPADPVHGEFDKESNFEVRHHVVSTIRAFVETVDTAGVLVTIIDAARTFWEKLTILHKPAHRFDGQPDYQPADRYSRHYYDVYQLSKAGFAGDDPASDRLIHDVRFAAQTFFAESRAKYEEFTPGSIRLIPSDEGVLALQRDYAAMADMIFGVYPSFDEIIAELRRLDNVINRR